VHTCTQRLMETGGDVLSVLIGQYVAVDFRQQRRKRRDNASRVDVLELFPELDKIQAQVVLAAERGREPDDVLLPHASHPVEAIGVVWRDPRDHQHRRGGVEPGSTGEGMRTTTG